MTGYPEPPPPGPALDAITYIEQGATDDIRRGERRLVIWDRAIWWRTYRAGGFDGYRTLTGRRLPCCTMEQAVRRPDLAEEIRRLSRR